MSIDCFSLKGRVALVTGSSRGIGLALAAGLGRAGATVILNGVTEDRLELATRNLAEDGLNVHAFAFDVTQSDQVDRQLTAVARRVGPVDILVNNAGIQHRGPLESMAEEDWRRIVEVNLSGAFLVAKRVVSGMIQRKRGKIINICSLASELARATIGPYTAAKGGLKMLTKSMAVEWGKHNIQANGIGPGYFDTAMCKPLVEDPAFCNWLYSRVPAGRWGKPPELIGAAVFLSSEASDYVNGHILYVDGGLLATM